MEIRCDICFYLSLFIILNVSETVQQHKNVERVCGKPAQTVGFIVHGKEFNRGAFPWMVALLNKQKNAVEFFGAGTLISTRHVITGKNQSTMNAESSFADKI